MSAGLAASQGPERGRPIPWGQLLGIVGGLTALLYIAGAALLWVRLRSLGLPAGTLVSYLPREFVISTGIREVALPWLVLVLSATAVVLVASYYRAKRRPFSLSVQHRRFKDLAFTAYAALPFVIAGFLFVVGDRDDALILGLVGVGCAVVLAADYGYRSLISRGTVTRPTALILFTLVSGLGALPYTIYLINRAWEPQDVIACLKDGGSTGGVFIGDSGGNLYIGQGIEEAQDATTSARVVAIRSTELSLFFIGNEIGDDPQSEQLCQL